MVSMEKLESAVAQKKAHGSDGLDLIGMDLQGNTYWEFRDTLDPNRFRRIAKHNPQTHYADIQISPQWHQWLRRTRREAPSLEEQQADVQRQLQLKHLAQLADERWAAKPSLLDNPSETVQPGPATLPRDSAGYAGKTEPDKKEGVKNQVVGVEGRATAGASSSDQLKETVDKPGRQPKPWQGAKPENNWQPQAWKSLPGRRKG